MKNFNSDIVNERIVLLNNLLEINNTTNIEKINKKIATLKNNRLIKVHIKKHITTNFQLENFQKDLNILLNNYMYEEEINNIYEYILNNDKELLSLYSITYSKELNKFEIKIGCNFIFFKKNSQNNLICIDNLYILFSMNETNNERKYYNKFKTFIDNINK